MGSQPGIDMKSKQNTSSNNPQWSPYMDGILGVPEDEEEIKMVDEIIEKVLYDPRTRKPYRLPVFEQICSENNA